MASDDSLPAIIDRLVVTSHVNAVNVLLQMDRRQCQERLTCVLDRLRSGAYLIGTGPGTVGIMPLSVDRVILGRAATPLEHPRDMVVDIQANDTVYLGPHEVSRVHAAVQRSSVGCKDATFRLLDLGSTCGTYLNGARVPDDEIGYPLESGDVISLGVSHCSTFVFLNKTE